MNVDGLQMDGLHVQSPRAPFDLYANALVDQGPGAHASKPQDNYLTPDSKESSSEHDCCQDVQWTDARVKVLRYLLHYDLTLDLIQSKLPDISMTAIIHKLKSLQNDITWTRTETVYIARCIQAKTAVDPHQFPLRSQHDIRIKIYQVETYISGFNSDSSWSNYELAVLCHQLNFDMTAGGLFEELPDKSIDDIAKCIERIDFAWTPIEIFYLRIAKQFQHDQESIEGELPFRSPRDLQAQINTVVAYDLHVDQVLIDYLITSGLTLERLRYEFPGVPTREIIMLNTTTRRPLTDVEKSVIEDLYQTHSVNYIQSLLPLRRASYLSSLINEMRGGYRRLRFKNSMEKLIYESQWYTGDNFGGQGNGSTRSSRRKRPLKLVDDNFVADKSDNSGQLTLEEFKLKRTQAKLQEELKRKRHQEKRRLLEQRRIEAMNKPKKVKVSNSEAKQMLWKKLKEEADYFQSVTGNKQLIKDNEKRKRQKTVFFVPPSQERRILKHIMKKKTRHIRSKKGRKGQGDNDSDNTSESESGSDSESEDGEEGEEDDEEEDNVSPYDPYDIIVDTEFSIDGRQLFIDDIYKSSPSLPILEQISEEVSQTVDPLSDSRIEISDSSAARIIVENQKRYKDLPPSFPKVLSHGNQGDYINPHNKVRVRTLLYPEHCELFILGLPKSEELNPVLEIQKFFQIHYCLYFSHSMVLKEIIYNDYCLNLEKTVAMNDVTKFMNIIDNWNQLMLVLSPRPIAPDVFSIDINPEIRRYKTRKPADLMIPGLKLDMFYKEILDPQDQPIMPELLPKRQLPPVNLKHIATKQIHTPEPSPDIENVEFKLPVVHVPELDIDHGPFRRPHAYVSKFFQLLSVKNTVSRYCMQQMLIRVYSRVVSTRSSKLRRYKAFTAEVYGELLPSFVSEVLTKVGFKPGQKFYDLGCGVGNTSFQAALEFGAGFSGGCELMEHASLLTSLQENVLAKQLAVFGIKSLNMDFVLSQSFVNNQHVRKHVLDCDVLIINNYLFDMKLNFEVGRLLYGIKKGAKLISLRNFITPRYKSTGDATVFDYLSVEKHEMSDFLSVSWTANKVPYYISTVEATIQPQYLL